MQAPTTPHEDAPAQDPGDRTCPSCGAANGLTSAFCWQCYRPFGAPAVAPFGAPARQLAGSYTRPPETPAGTAGASWTPPYASPRTPGGWAPGPSTFEAPAPRRNLGTMLGVTLLTLVLIGAAVLFVGRDHAVAMPESVGGMAKLDDQQAKVVADSFRSQIEAIGVEGNMALYGDGIPAVAVMWIRDASVPTTAAAFDQFASGFDSGVGTQGALDRVGKTTQTVAGVTYVCAPVRSAAPGTLCMWQDDDVFWLLYDFSGARFQAGQDLAVATHDTISA